MTDSDAVLAALLGTLVGDCLGAPYEGAAPVPWADADARLERALQAAPLRYTDDTQLAFALAEHLAATPDVEPDRLAEVMLARFEPDRGYGPGTLRLFGVWQQAGAPSGEAARELFGEGSFGNGAAMRVAPLGALLAGQPALLDEAAERSARVTHTHPLGVDGALAQARAVGVARRDAGFRARHVGELARGARTPQLRAGLHAAATAAQAWSAGERPASGVLAERLGTAATAQRSVPAALWCAAVAADAAAAVRLALALGGDTDTIAAMAAAVRTVADGPSAIPAAWLEAVEEGAVAEARALAARFGPADQDRPSTS